MKIENKVITHKLVSSIVPTVDVKAFVDRQFVSTSINVHRDLRHVLTLVNPRDTAYLNFFVIKKQKQKNILFFFGRNWKYIKQQNIKYKTISW